MRVALAQICTTVDLDENLSLVETYARQAVDLGADVVVFPEATMRAFGYPLAPIAEPIDGAWGSTVSALARELGITIVVGMFTPGDADRVRNTLLIAGPDTVDAYDKVHLFDAFGFSESDTVAPGEHTTVTDIGGVAVGVAICYDIRFPALFLRNAREGARVQFVCASWGAGPGKLDQWELLARARAVDTTSYVVAVGQADPASIGIEPRGTAPTGIGHSLVVSPTGEVLLSLGASPELAVIDLDLAAVDGVRERIPVLANARRGVTDR